MKHFFAAAMTLCLMIASCGKIHPSSDDPIKTGEATQITQNSAVLWGAVDPSELSQGVEMGIIYSDSENPSVENGIIRVSRELDKNNMFFVEAKGLTTGTKFYYRAFLNIGGIYRVGDVKSFTTEAFKYTAVDLGLPSGLKWATCNVGATAPEEYGDYFAWGDPEPNYTSQDPLTWRGNKTGYNWASYKFELGTGWEGPFSKYVIENSYNIGNVDNKTVLDPEDDAAAVNWGGTWRMPTLAEWRELLDECTWTRTTQNGVNGRLVTGPNGNSIFLPAAGYRYYTGFVDAGSTGSFWSSSLCTDYPYYAYGVYFGSDYYFWYDYYRYFGRSVRAVTE